MGELTSLGAEGLLGEFCARRVSPVEALDAFAARIDAVDLKVGAFTTLCLDLAREEARAAEAAWTRGEARPLEGVPLGVKDLFDSAGVRTTYGSTMFASHLPAKDAEALRRARAAGAILVGKTQTHEFAWGISSVNELMGSTRNPWALDRISGGSSGGSAVALAADELPLALGSDTGGSIRVPSCLCGTVGLKPTYGRISLAGAWPLARTLDHPGPMARTPADAALLLVAIAGADDADPASEDVPLGDVAGELRRGFAGLTVGLCTDLHLVELAPDVRAAYEAAVRAAEHGGARVVEVSLPEAGLDVPSLRRDPARRGARHAPPRGPLPRTALPRDRARDRAVGVDALEHGLRERPGVGLEVPPGDAVLRPDRRRARLERRTEPRRQLGQAVRLERDEDGVRVADRRRSSSVACGCAVKSPRGDEHPHAVLAHRSEVRATRDQRDLGAAAGERGADVRADRPRADHGEPHWASLCSSMNAATRRR